MQHPIPCYRVSGVREEMAEGKLKKSGEEVTDIVGGLFSNVAFCMDSSPRAGIQMDESKPHHIRHDQSKSEEPLHVIPKVGLPKCKSF
jgi:hypothetical protein